MEKPRVGSSYRMRGMTGPGLPEVVDVSRDGVGGALDVEVESDSDGDVGAGEKVDACEEVEVDGGVEVVAETEVVAEAGDDGSAACSDVGLPEHPAGVTARTDASITTAANSLKRSECPGGSVRAGVLGSV